MVPSGFVGKDKILFAPTKPLNLIDGAKDGSKLSVSNEEQGWESPRAS